MRSSLQLTSPGWVILVSAMVLVSLGVASIYVTDTHYLAGHDGPANAAKQSVRVILGLALAWIVLRLGYQNVARYAYALFFVALALLVPLLIARLTHSSFGGLTAPRNGAYRWIHLPAFRLQPSEVMKVAYILSLAWYLRYRENYRRLSGLLVPVVASAIPLALILLEPDLGTALLLIPVLFTMLFLAGARTRHLLAIALVGFAVIPLAWGQIRGYQRARVTAVLLQSEGMRQAVLDNPDRYKFLVQDRRQVVEWAASSGYQLVHSKNAIGSGGLIGQGWGNGVYVQSGLLPDRHNDFIFALVAHQWGMIGCLLVLTCFVAIILAGVRIASATTDPFGRLLAVGVMALLGTQVLINVAMTVGLMPITGMTLPFVSYGGSSMLSNFAAIALLISVSQRRPFLLETRAFEYGRTRGDAPLAAYGGVGSPAGTSARADTRT